MRYWFKECPHCRKGDLREEGDLYGTYIACVQCGYVLRAEEEAAIYSGVHIEPAPQREKAAA